MSYKYGNYGSHELIDAIALAPNEFLVKMSLVGANEDWQDWRGFHDQETAVSVDEHGSVFEADSHVNWGLTRILSH